MAVELTEKDALRAHLDIELGIDPDELTNPWHAAWASMLAFTLGAVLPLLTILLVLSGAARGRDTCSPSVWLSPVPASSAPGSAMHRRVPAVVRVVVGGLLAMAVTYGDRHAGRHRNRLIRRAEVSPARGETVVSNVGSHVDIL